jgi:F-type H+-transporting ATPase subunit alpha
VDKFVKEFADDFGYDLDEEGQPLDDAGSDRVTTQPESPVAEDEATEPEPEPAAV